MNLPLLVWRYLLGKPLNTMLNIVLLSLGMAVIVLIIIFTDQFRENMVRNTKGIDLVVGAKGSPLQLILCSVFHVDFPTGNISLAEAERLATHRLVKATVPLALGDSYQGFRIVGTTHAYPEWYEAQLKTGSWWAHDFEAVAGAGVAKTLGLKVGDFFESAHGLEKGGHLHEGHAFRVTGVMDWTYSALDNLLLTTVPSVWKVHEDSSALTVAAGEAESPLIPGIAAGDTVRQITSLLVRYRNPMAVIQLPRMINAETSMQAASPAFESARLFALLSSAISVLTGLAYVLIFVAALSIFIALYNSLRERKYDLAIMRAMGARPARLLGAVLLEGITLTFWGAVIGILLGHGVMALFLTLASESVQAGFSPLRLYWEELYVLLGSLVLGALCSCLPAWQAYRVDIHQVLAGQ